MNLFMRKRKTPKESESNHELKSVTVQDTKSDTSNKSKAKKKFSFMRSKTKSNPESIAQRDNTTRTGFSDSSSNDAKEFRYSDVSTFVKIQDCDLPNSSFLQSDLKTLMKVAETVPEESPCHSSPLGNYEGTSISESFSWKADTWKDPWCDPPPQSPSINSWADDHSESQTSSTLEKRRKPFFPFRSSDSTKGSEKRGSCRMYGKKGIDLETTKQLNQMISLVASEESDDPWEESWNRWQSSDTFTADSFSESERMTPDSGWADFSVFDKPLQITSPSAVSNTKIVPERLMNSSKDSTESLASHDNVPPLYERDSSPVFQFASGKNQKRQRPRSWFRSSSKYNSSVLQEAQTLLDILHETFPEQELGSPDTDLRTV